MKITIEATPQELKETFGSPGEMMIEPGRLHIKKTAEVDIPAETELKIKHETPKKPRTAKAEADIAAIKSAYYAKKADKKPAEQKQNQPKRAAGGRKRVNLDMKEVIRLHEEEKCTFNQIGEMFGCSGWTVRDKYIKAKGE